MSKKKIWHHTQPSTLQNTSGSMFIFFITTEVPYDKGQILIHCIIPISAFTFNIISNHISDTKQCTLHCHCKLHSKVMRYGISSMSCPTSPVEGFSRLSSVITCFPRSIFSVGFVLSTGAISSRSKKSNLYQKLASIWDSKLTLWKTVTQQLKATS